MNLSVIRYYGLRHKSNHQIQAKFCLVYGKVALCSRTVNTWAVRFRSRRISVEDHIFGLFHSRRVCFHRRTSEKGSKRERFNSAFFTLTILPNIIRSMCMLRPKIWPKATGCISTMLNLTKLPCHFRKLKRHGSSDYRNCPIPMIWHPVTSSYSGTWKKNEKGGIVGPKSGDLCGKTNFQAIIINWFW
jgi:hypothetical protein